LDGRREEDGERDGRRTGRRDGWRVNGGIDVEMKGWMDRVID
jgi:hypothetical protein